MTILETIASVSKTIGHTGRLRILAMLRAGPLSVCQIAAVLEAPVSTVSGHLLELRHADLVRERRQWKWVYYSLTETERIIAVLGPLLTAIETDPEVRRDAATATTLQGRSPSPLCEAAAVDASQVRS